MLTFWLQVGLRSDPIWHFMTQLPKMSRLADFFNFVKISVLESCQAIQPGGCNGGMWVMLTSQKVFFSEANALLILRQLLRCFLVNSIDQPSVRLLITQTRQQYISVKVNTFIFITVYRQLSLVELL